MCISLKGQQWVDSFVSNLSMKTFVVDATDVGDVVLKTEAALTYARQLSRPAAILYKNLRRRFGHAATDRQLAYLSPDEVEEAAGYSNLERKWSLFFVLLCCSLIMSLLQPFSPLLFKPVM